MGKDIFSAYCMYIAPWIEPFHVSEPLFRRLAYAGIEKENKEKRERLLEEAADTKVYLSDIVDYSDTISSIEKVF